MHYITQKLINNLYVYSVIAKIIGVATGFLYSILYSRFLGAELRGEASVIINIATIVSLVMCLGIYQAYPYFRKNKINLEELYISYINKVLGLFLVYFFGCIAFALYLPISKDLKIALILMPFIMGTKELNYVVLIERPRLRNTASIILNLIDIVILAILMLFTSANYFICFAFLITKEILYFSIAFKNLKVRFFSLRPTLKGIFPYIKFGIVPMITVILMEINYKIDILMLNGNVSMADIGIYSLGVQLAERLWLIPDAIKDILLSKLTKGKGPIEVAKSIRISLLMIIISIVFAIFLGKPFITIFFGKEYSGSYKIMLTILVSIISMVFYKMVYSYNVANGMRYVNMIILGITALTNVILNYALIPLMGNLGAATASLTSYSVCGIVFLIYFHKRTGLSYYDILIMKKSDIEVFKRFFQKED